MPQIFPLSDLELKSDAARVVSNDPLTTLDSQSDTKLIVVWNEKDNREKFGRVPSSIFTLWGDNIWRSHRKYSNSRISRRLNISVKRLLTCKPNKVRDCRITSQVCAEIDNDNVRLTEFTLCSMLKSIFEKTFLLSRFWHFKNSNFSNAS